MSLDDFLIAIILAGIGLTGVYLRAELLWYRKITELQRRKERDIHGE